MMHRVGDSTDWVSDEFIEEFNKMVADPQVQKNIRATKSLLENFVKYMEREFPRG